MIDHNIFTTKQSGFLCGTLVFLLIAILFSGCGKHAHMHTRDFAPVELDFVYLSPETDDWPDQKLKNTFSFYWHHRFAEKINEDLFSYEAPHFQKMASYSKYDAYINNFAKGDILRIEIASFIPATEYLYEIPLEIVFLGNNGQEETLSVRDRWVLVEGKWYHVLRDPLAFPGLG